MFATASKILIIDDTKSLRELLRAHLRRMGFWNIHEAENGQDALDKLWQGQNANDPFHLVISDWNMPEMTGIDLLKRVRMAPDWKGLPFLLLTTDSEKAKIVEAVQAQVSNYMVKPIDADTLKEKLSRIWEKHHARN